MAEGASFVLHNNLWGTNYVMWTPYTLRDEHMRFRFVLQVVPAQEPKPLVAAQ